MGGTWPQAPRLGNIRDEIKKRLALAEKGNLEQLMNDAINDQEKQTQQEKESKGPGAMDTENENDRFLRAAGPADRGQLRTSPRLLTRLKLLPPTETTADAIEQLYQTSDAAQKRTKILHLSRSRNSRKATSDRNTSSRTSETQEDKLTPGPSGERNGTHFSTVGVATWPCDTYEMGAAVGGQET